MAAKAILVICAHALLIQSAFSQCVNPAAIDATRYGAPFSLAGRGWGYDGLGFGYGAPIVDITATCGGGLPVTSASAIPPFGVSIASENVYEGILSAAGELPFVGTVGVEGVLPTAGAGAVNYGCGNGATAMVATDGLGIDGLGIGAYGAGIGAYGPGIGAFGPATIAPAASIISPSFGYSDGLACGFGY